MGWQASGQPMGDRRKTRSAFRCHGPRRRLDLAELTGQVLAEDRAMLQLADRSGFASRTSAEPSVVDVLRRLRT